MTVRYYAAILERSLTGFGVYFPDLNGCISAGATMEQAAANAEEALALHLGGMAKDGNAIPAPTPLDQIQTDPDIVEAGRILVRAKISPGFVPASSESAAWFRQALADIGETQHGLARWMRQLGDDRSPKTILRSIERMASGDARVSGEMRVILAIRLKRAGKAITAGRDNPAPAPAVPEV